MQDPVLRSQTASEPLTLEQEHEMQQSWIRDNDSKIINDNLLLKALFFVLCMVKVKYLILS